MRKQGGAATAIALAIVAGTGACGKTAATSGPPADEVRPPAAPPPPPVDAAPSLASLTGLSVTAGAVDTTPGTAVAVTFTALDAKARPLALSAYVRVELMQTIDGAPLVLCGGWAMFDRGGWDRGSDGAYHGAVDFDDDKKNCIQSQAGAPVVARVRDPDVPAAVATAPVDDDVVAKLDRMAAYDFPPPGERTHPTAPPPIGDDDYDKAVDAGLATMPKLVAAIDAAKIDNTHIVQPCLGDARVHGRNPPTIDYEAVRYLAKLGPSPGATTADVGTYRWMGSPAAEAMLTRRDHGERAEAPEFRERAVHELRTGGRLWTVYRATSRRMPVATGDHTFVGGELDGTLIFVDLSRGRAICWAPLHAASTPSFQEKAEYVTSTSATVTTDFEMNFRLAAWDTASMSGALDRDTFIEAWRAQPHE